MQNLCKMLGFKKNMVYKIPPGGEGKPYPASGLVVGIVNGRKWVNSHVHDKECVRLFFYHWSRVGFQKNACDLVILNSIFKCKLFIYQNLVL